MVAFCLQLAANVHSQSITMQMQNTSLKKIFLEIEKKSIYSVIFNDDAIPKEKVFSVNASNEDVRDILDNLLSSTSLTYKISKHSTGNYLEVSYAGQANYWQGYRF